MKEILGLTAALLTIVSLTPYIIDTFKQKTKPHIFTWVIWSVTTMLAFLGILAKGGGPGAWTTGVTGLITIFIAILAFKKGTKDITTSDKIYFTGALFAVIPWYFTKDPTVSIILVTTIDVLAFFPTIRKTLNNSSSETLFTFCLNVIVHILALTALANYNIATIIFPAALAVMNMIVVGAILLPKKTLSG